MVYVMRMTLMVTFIVMMTINPVRKDQMAMREKMVMSY